MRALSARAICTRRRRYRTRGPGTPRQASTRVYARCRRRLEPMKTRSVVTSAARASPFKPIVENNFWPVFRERVTDLVLASRRRRATIKLRTEIGFHFKASERRRVRRATIFKAHAFTSRQFQCRRVCETFLRARARAACYRIKCILIYNIMR